MYTLQANKLLLKEAGTHSLAERLASMDEELPSTNEPPGQGIEKYDQVNVSYLIFWLFPVSI
jgi:hypothetical protein